MLTSQRMDKEDMRQSIKERMEKSQGGQASPEQIERGVAMGEKIGAVTRWLVPLFIVVVYLLVARPLLRGVPLLRRAAQSPYKTSFAVALHAYMPALVAALLTLPLILSRQEHHHEGGAGG